MDPILLQSLITFSGVIIGSGIIQFFVNRKDKKQDDLKNDRFEQLEKKFQEGLDAREATGKHRFDEHAMAIEEMKLEHQKDFQELSKAIQKLVENDAKFSESIDKMVDKQDLMAQANVGMMHNTIIRFTSPIIDRNAVTYEELANLDSLYVPYSKLGGNGECKRRYEDVNKLAKISREEAVKRDRAIATQKFQEIQKAIVS